MYRVSYSIVKPAGNSLNVNVGSDSRKRWQLFMGVSGQRDEEGGWNASVGPNLRLQPSARVQAFVSTQYSFGRDIAQWITNRDVDDDGQMDYIYGRLRRDVVNASGRATYAFSRGARSFSSGTCRPPTPHGLACSRCCGISGALSAPTAPMSS